MFQNVMTSRKPLQDLTIEVVQDGAEIPEDENYTKESKNNSQESVPCLFYNLKDLFYLSYLEFNLLKDQYLFDILH